MHGIIARQPNDVYTMSNIGRTSRATRKIFRACWKYSTTGFCRTVLKIVRWSDECLHIFLDFSIVFVVYPSYGRVTTTVITALPGSGILHLRLVSATHVRIGHLRISSADARPSNELQRLTTCKVPHGDVIEWKRFPRYWPLCWEFTGHRWIPPTKASDAERWSFLWSALEQTDVQTIETPVIETPLHSLLRHCSEGSSPVFARRWHALRYMYLMRIMYSVTSSLLFNRQYVQRKLRASIH